VTERWLAHQAWSAPMVHARQLSVQATKNVHRVPAACSLGPKVTFGCACRCVRRTRIARRIKHVSMFACIRCASSSPSMLDVLVPPRSVLTGKSATYRKPRFGLSRQNACVPVVKVMPHAVRGLFVLLGWGLVAILFRSTVQEHAISLGAAKVMKSVLWMHRPIEDASSIAMQPPRSGWMLNSPKGLVRSDALKQPGSIGDTRSAPN